MEEKKVTAGNQSEVSVLEQATQIRMPHGVCDALIYRPAGEQQFPGAIHLTDIVGIRPAHCGMARRLSAQGYVVLLPNVFYRSGRPPLFDFTPKLGGGSDHETVC